MGTPTAPCILPSWAAGTQVEQAAAQLHSTCHEELYVAGLPYPGPEAVRREQLQLLLDELWAAHAAATALAAGAL